MMHKSISTAIALAVSVLATLSWLHSALELTRVHLRLPTHIGSLELSSPTSLRAFSLNHATFAADLGFIAAIVDHGENLREHRTAPHLLKNAYVVAELDPTFYALYEWAPAAYLSRRTSPTEEELIEVNAFVDMGIEAFPGNGDLPFSAAMTYIGYGGYATSERRLRETRRALEYLRRAGRAKKPPENLPLVHAWFANRERKLLGEEADAEAREREIMFNLDLYRRAHSPLLKRVIEEYLEERGVSREAILAENFRMERRVDALRLKEAPHLPTGLWLILRGERS